MIKKRPRKAAFTAIASVRRIGAAMAGSVAFTFLASPLAAQTLSIALSDNLVVLDDKQRSGSIDLVNLSDEPTEFSLEMTLEPTGEQAGHLLRWAPSRSLVRPHSTAPVRFSVRPASELPPGEYEFRVGITAKVRPVPKLNAKQEDAPPDGFAVSIPIVPTLPVTVYFRHKIPTPAVEVGALKITPQDPRTLGHFPIFKVAPEYSFVGQVQILDETTVAVVNSGRLHLKPGGKETVVNMPRAKTEKAGGDRYCLKVWNQFPGTGPAAVDTCKR